MRCCHVLKRNGHTPTTCRNSTTLGVMFPFGAIGAWSKAQRAKWQRSALHVVDTVVTPISAASFHILQRNNFCSAPFRLSFSCWMSFTTRGPILGPILNPTKTENEFPSKGKPQIPGKTSQQWRLKTYRDHTRTESFMKTSIEDFDTCGDFDWTFRCLGVRTSLQLCARCHCHLGPWSPNAGATLKTPQKITKQE